MGKTLPPFLEPFFWSYDLKALDKEADKKRIVTNILNWGDKKATDWLFDNYSKAEIENAIKSPLPGEWNDKSIHYWSLILGVTPGGLKRKLPN